MNLEVAERRREEIRRLCAERMIAITRYGSAWRIHGQGVDLVAVDLAWVQPSDLRIQARIARR